MLMLMSAVETGQMSAAETGQMSAVETRQKSDIAKKLCPCDHSRSIWTIFAVACLEVNSQVLATILDPFGIIFAGFGSILFEPVEYSM